MGLVRHLLTCLVAVALAQFAIAASAPAHAHETQVVHGVPAIELVADFAHHHDGHADDVSGHGHDHAPLPGDSQPAEGGVHVHACPHFAAPTNDARAFQPRIMEAKLVARTYAGVISNLSAPPLRPPRAIL